MNKHVLSTPYWLIKYTEDNFLLLPRQWSGLFEATTLNELLLCNNEIQVLPEDVGNLENLKVLELSHNRLSSIPATVSKISSFEKLGFSFNQLDASGISTDLSQLSKLTKCTLHSNRFHEKPDLRGIVIMKHLNFNDNFISADNIHGSARKSNVVTRELDLYDAMTKEAAEIQSVRGVLEKASCCDVDWFVGSRDIHARTLYAKYFSIGVAQRRAALSCSQSAPQKVRSWAGKAICSFNVAEGFCFCEGNPELYVIAELGAMRLMTILHTLLVIWKKCYQCVLIIFRLYMSELYCLKKLACSLWLFKKALSCFSWFLQLEVKGLKMKGIA